MLRAGDLDQRVTIQAPATGQNDYGEPLLTWTDVATVWASINDLTGREFIAAGAAQSAVTTKIGIRYLAGVVPAMRVLYGSDVYNISAVLGQDRVSLLLMCERGANLG